MSFDAEKEISKLLGGLHMAQAEIGRTYFRWRKAAIEIAGPGAKPLDVGLKAAEVIGAELGKQSLPRLNWLKGEEVWLQSLAGGMAIQWRMQGAIVKVEKGEKPTEVFIKWERCPWPSYAKENGVPMEEDVLCCDRILESILPDVNTFFNVNYKIETLKAIPRGQGVCLRRLYKEE